MNKVKKQVSLLAFTLLCALLSTNSIYGQSMRLENQIIGKLDIIIATEPSDASSGTVHMIRTRLKTREGDIFSQTSFDNDLKMLVQDYDRVEPMVESVDDKIFITLKIWPKPCIRSVCWEGNHRIKTKRLQSELGINSGEVFDRQCFNQAFHNVKGYYIKQGFFEAQLNYVVEYDELTNEVELIISIEEGRAGKIKQIVFCNFTKCEEEELLEMMVTKKYNFFLSWLTGEGTYNEEMIQHDEFLILNYLQNHGYADAEIDLDVCEAKENNRIIIYITADRGARYYFGDITIEGYELYSSEDLLKCITICPGKPFSPELIHHSMQC